MIVRAKPPSNFHKHLLSLAVGGVGLYFLALTGKVDPPLTPVQKVIVLFAMISWAVAALSGIISWNADCRRNFFWASALQAGDREKRTELYRQRDRWLKRSQLTAKYLVTLFIVGVVASAAYVALRVVAE